LGGGDCAVEGGVEQWARDRDDEKSCQCCQRGGGADVGGAESEDRAEEDAYPRRAVPGAALGGEDGEEEDAEPERPGKQRADDDVVGACGSPSGPIRMPPRTHATKRPARMLRPSTAAALR
jgi:hypothetical protein